MARTFNLGQCCKPLHRWLTVAVFAAMSGMPVELRAQETWTSLTALGRDGENSRITILDSVDGSGYTTPEGGLQVWCVNAGIEGAAYHTDNHTESPALTYRVVPFSMVSANAAAFFDNDSSWPDYDALNDPFGRWAEAALEYAHTYYGVFRDQVQADGYDFQSHYMQSIVSEIAHESAATFGVSSDDGDPDRGFIFGEPSAESRLVDAYFSWMKTGSASLDGFTWINAGELLSEEYDNPAIELVYLDRDHSEPDFHLTQDYIAFQATPVPEPSGIACAALAGLAAALRRKRPSVA